MKILQVNSVYKKGSTGKIMFDLHSNLQDKDILSVVCYGRGQKIKEKNVYKTSSEIISKINNVFSRVTGIMYGGNFLATNKLISIIKKEKPDIVHLQCINGYFVNIYRLVTFLKMNNVKTILTLHAEFIYTANCGYSLDCINWKTGCGNCASFKKVTKSMLFDRTAKSFYKMKKAFKGFDDNLIVTSVSPWLMERAKQSPILSNKKHCVVFNGVNIGIFKTHDTSELRKQHNLTDEKIIFHATPMFDATTDHIKGGEYVVELAKRLSSENATIIIAGKYNANMRYPDNMIFLGNVSDQTLLAKYYSLADVTLLTSKKETFSMICAESFCCGTPVVGFKAGAPEQISLKNHSVFVDFGDVDSLEKILRNTPISNMQNKEDIMLVAHDVYSKERMARNYLNVYGQFEDM